MFQTKHLNKFAKPVFYQNSRKLTIPAKMPGVFIGRGFTCFHIAYLSRNAFVHF
jgi:hypothetical protein